MEGVREWRLVKRERPWSGRGRCASQTVRAGCHMRVEAAQARPPEKKQRAREFVRAEEAAPAPRTPDGHEVVVKQSSKAATEQ
eukprot:268649-Rhodomonas_salina.1